MRSVVVVILFAAACGGRSPVAPFDPSLQSSVPVLRFAARVNEVVAPQYVSVVDAHGLGVEWSAAKNANWLHLSPDDGVTPADVRVSVSTRGLAPGTHRTGVHLSIDGDEEGSTSFVVELTLSAPGWTSLNGPYGGWATAVAVNPVEPDVIVVGAHDGDLLVSTDNGASFVHHKLDGPEPVGAIAFADGSRAYAGAEGVYRSDDGGRTWSRAGLDNRTVTTLAIDPTDPDRLLAEGDGLWRSVDAGETWEEVPTPESCYWLVSDNTRPGTFVVACNNGNVYTTSTTLGSGVSAVTNTGFTAQEVVSIAVLPSGRWVAAHDVDSSHSPALRVSDDAGASWSDPGAAGLADEEQSVWLWLAVVGDELYGLHKGVYRSRDGGVTFESVSVGISNYRGGDRRWHAAAGHPDGLLLAHHSLGLIRYADTGSAQLPMIDFGVRGVEVDPVTSDLVGIVDPGGAFAYSGGSFRGIGSNGMYAAYPNDISLDPRSSASIAVAGEDNQIMITTNGGESWVRGGAGLTLEDGKAIARAPDDPDVLWVGGANLGFFRSADHGASWTRITGAGCYHTAAISATEALFFAGGEIRHSDSAGTITTLADPNDNMSMLRRTEDGAHWFGGHDGLLRSSDNGQSWNNLGLGEGHFNDIVTVPGDPSHVFVATASGLLESRDTGASWTNIDSPFTAASLAWDPNANLLVVGTFGGGIYTYSP